MLNIDRTKIEVPCKVRFWGQECECDPRFVEQALGNGDFLVGIQPLNTRPHYYVIRMDSSWHFAGSCRTCADGCPDDIAEHLDDIYEAIEDEYGAKERINDENENELEEGEEPESTDWPVLNSDSGVSWFAIDPAKYLSRAA